MGGRLSCRAPVCGALLVAACAGASLPTGHIFVLNSDVRFLACDAWLCPVGKSMNVPRHWQIRASEVPEQPAGWGERELCVRCNPKLEAERGPNHGYEHPDPYLAYVLGDGSESLSLEQLSATLRAFLALVHEDLQAREARGAPSRFGRALPLVALPILSLIHI